MIDPVSVAVTLGVLGVGWVVGRHARLQAQPKPLQPICLCEHHYGAHDPQTGECCASWWEPPWPGYPPIEHHCSCVRYTGPQPVEQYWVPPSADMSIVTAPRVGDR